MNMAPWQLFSLPSVSISLAEFTHQVARMKKWGVAYDTNSHEFNSRSGQIAWGSEFDGKAIGIAWEWGETHVNVAALADPMAIMSNVILLAEDGSALSESRRLIVLNGAIHSLAWQLSVPKRNQLLWEDTLMAA